MSVVGQLLAGGKNSRLYQRLVYDLQIADDVSAFQGSARLSSAFYIIATARSGHTLAEIEQVIDEEIARLQAEAPTPRELERIVNQYETSFLEGLERPGDKADQLNAYYYATGNPDYFNEDLARFRALAPADLTAMARAFLRPDARVLLSIVPQGQTALAAEGSRPVAPAGSRP